MNLWVIASRYEYEKDFKLFDTHIKYNTSINVYRTRNEARKDLKIIKENCRFNLVYKILKATVNLND